MIFSRNLILSYVYKFLMFFFLVIVDVLGEKYFLFLFYLKFIIFHILLHVKYYFTSYLVISSFRKFKVLLYFYLCTISYYVLLYLILHFRVGIIFLSFHCHYIFYCTLITIITFKKYKFHSYSPC